MKIDASSPDDYIRQLPDDRKLVISKLRSTILEHLPPGFAETMSYGMISYVVPHSRYPAGYHCDPKQPLPFMSIASQKNFISFYHMGIYASESLMDWFLDAWNSAGLKKPDMGKSCIRFKKPELIPFELLGNLAGKMSVADWIALYENAIKSL